MLTCDVVEIEGVDRAVCRIADRVSELKTEVVSREQPRGVDPLNGIFDNRSDLLKVLPSVESWIGGVWS